jgi:hypothetical protein
MNPQETEELKAQVQRDHGGPPTPGHHLGQLPLAERNRLQKELDDSEGQQTPVGSGLASDP